MVQESTTQWWRAHSGGVWSTLWFKEGCPVEWGVAAHYMAGINIEPPLSPLLWETLDTLVSLYMSATAQFENALY